jgi:hypothetical protein
MTTPSHLPRRQGSAERTPRRVRPQLELLEPRTLLSTLTVLNLNDSGAGSLRQALISASAGDTINFAVSGQITLTSGPLQINQDLTISGPAAANLTVSGNNASRVFNIGDVNVALSGLTVADGNSASSGGAVLMSSDPSKTLSLSNCVFTSDHAFGPFNANGGAVEITGDGTMSVNDCDFTNCSASSNGGVIDSPGIFLAVTNSTFSANSAGNGGAVSIGNDGVSFANCTFFGNTAASNAGAVFSDFNANYSLVNCTVAGNSASVGGGISILGGSLTLQNTIVAGNTAGTGPDISGSVNSQGNNLIGETDGSSGYVGSDLTGTAASPLPAGLGTLGNYGGPTPVVPLLQGSPALGHGSGGGAPTTDQRGAPRVAPVDIGAVQLLNAVVTNTNDSGAGSLRQVILNTNAHPGNDLITFAIPGSGLHVIRPISPLPAITDTVTIDGYSQPGSSPNTLPAADNAVIGVVIDGQGQAMHGLILANVSGCVVDGLSIVGMGNGVSGDEGGILISGSANNNLIEGNFLGILPDGQSANFNADGVFIANGASGNSVGGTNPAQRNLLSGNADWGFLIEGNDNTVAGNLIGLGADGLTSVANGNGGVIDQGASNNVIGGTAPATRNYIAGNGSRGVKLTIDHTTDAVTTGPNASGNQIEGNWIGLNISGSSAGGQSVAGVEVRNVGANAIGVPGAGDVISGNAGPGVMVFGNGATGNAVSSDLIGTDPTGSAAVGNGDVGLLVDGGASGSSISGNVISGNGSTGILLGFQAGATTIAANLIGLDASGTAALGNGLHGIQVFSGAPVLIGGDTAAERNIVSGNHNHGIALNATNTTVVGNYIGTNAAGTAAIGNGGSGIGLNAASGNVIGDTTANGGNVISGNTQSGVEFFNGSDTNTVVHNLIGTGADGSTNAGNGANGIAILSSADNMIGGTGAAQANIIQNNAGPGVLVDGSSNLATGNAIEGNSIFNNGSPGIFLTNGGNNGATEPPPVFTYAYSTAGSTTVSGSLSSVANTQFRIEFFASPTKDPSGAGQGLTFLGFTTVTTDASGNATFSLSNLPAVSVGQFLSATATDANNNTSHFAQDVLVTGLTSQLDLTGLPSVTTAGVSLNFSVTAEDSAGNVTPQYTGTVHFTSSDAQVVFPLNDVTLTSGAGAFSVTFNTAGAQSITATDAADSLAVGVTSTISPILSIAPVTAPAGEADILYNPVFTLSGGTTPYTTFQVNNFSAGGTGLAAPSVGANTVTFHSTPTAAGTATFSVTATDTAGAHLTRSYSITINPDPNAVFVTNCYQLLLSRAPEAAGFLFWLGMLDSGVSPSLVVQRMEASPEFLGDLVQGLYQHYLGRAADAIGLAAWSSQLAAGVSLEQVTAEILASPEYHADHSPPPAVGQSPSLGFVQGLYQQVLGRPGSSVECASWTRPLDAGALTPGQVALAFLTSQEYQTDLVNGGAFHYAPMWEGFYAEFLHRAAEQTGLADWVAALRSGMSDQAVLAGILGSPEGYQDWS